MSTIQYVILGVFILFAIAGVIVFATLGGSGAGNSSALNVTMWGTVSPSIIDNVTSSLNAGKPGTITINYTQRPLDTFAADLTEALAEGKGPDIVLEPSSFLLHDQNKLIVIPWKYVSERTFKDTFIQGGEIFLTDTGTYALPFIVDPLVMYWNRDMFNAQSIAVPPKSWDEVASDTPKLSQIAQDKTIIKSAVPFGEFANVANAKNILAALTLQAGGNLIVREGATAQNNLLEIPADSQISPFESAVTFFTQFADPSRPTYSWNRSLPNSRDDFLAGNLALYFGMASELQTLRAKNPNLNFDVAPLPQVRGSDTKVTFGDVYGLGILSNSKNQAGAFQAIALMVSQASIQAFSNTLGLPPVRRDLLTTLPGTSAGDVFWNSAIWTKTWLDPSVGGSSQVLKSMIESITSGQSKPSEAVRIASQQFDEILHN